MNMCPSNKRKPPPELCLKGQVFFIWSNHQIVEIAKGKICLLGGKVDTFLSKDVTTILIEDNHLTGPQLLSNDLQVKQYITNGVITSNFHHAGSLCNLPSTSRGFNLLACNSSNSPFRVLCYARQWGIRVLGIDYFLAWIEPQVKFVILQRKKTAENVSNLSGCFIKFESCYKSYRPCYKMFNNDPERLMPLKNANILVKPDTCNVILDRPIGPRQLHFNHMDTNDRTVNHVKDSHLTIKVTDKKPQNINKLKQKEENNYCECCRTHFVDLKQHIRSVKHQSFVSNEKNYESVHNILKMLPSAQEFLEKHQKPVQNSELFLSNGNVADEPEEKDSGIDFSMPLDLHIKRNDEICLPHDFHCKKDDDIPMPLNLQIKRNEESNLPLPLHIKNEEIKVEPDSLKEGKEQLVNDLENMKCRTEIDIVQPKIEIPDEGDLLVTVKLNDKETVCPSEVEEGVPNIIAPTDPLFDKTNTSALAQLCLKNFDSYWLDSLPCEMDDIIFDDNIFDFDDGKQKSFDIDHNECIDPVAESLVSVDAAQTPDLVSDILTPCLKTQSNTNNSFILNSSIDIRDVVVKNEPLNLSEIYPSACKMGKDQKELLRPDSVPAAFSEVLTSDKKLNAVDIFQVKSPINSFYAEKACVDVAPSCSNVMSNKLPEQMFSSDSSDDENGNVLISNVLNIITNSDSEMKVDKDSCEEHSASSPANSDKEFNLNSFKPEKPLSKAEEVVTGSVHNGLHVSTFVPTKSSEVPKIEKIPQKKSVPKIRKLPPLWSVSIVPGNGVRLKFTCIHPESIDTLASEDGESGFSD